MAYLSQNHCLETLEFTLDASRYRKYYADLMVDDASIAYGPDIGIRFGEAENKERLRQLWRKLVNAYIMPNASREVNLPSYVRDKLLNLTSIPPDPSVLDEAVKLVYELMDESVFVSFLNTVTEEKKSLWGTSSEDLDECPKDDDRPTRSFSPSRHNRESSPIASSISSLGERYLPKFSQRSHLSDAIKRSRKDANHPASASNGSNYITSPTYESDLSTGFGNFGLTEDSSTDSPASVNGSLNMDLLTPPVTPPTCDSYLPDDSEQESQWKKMGRTLGFSRGNVMGLSYRKSMKGRGKREKGVTSGGDTLSPMSSSSSASEPRGLQIQGLEWVDEDGRIR